MGRLSIFVFLLFFSTTLAFYKYGRPLQGAEQNDCIYSNCGLEVCITDFLLRSDPKGARDATKVENVLPDNVESYSGFASVNTSAANKLFFWYVPALNKDANAPLLIWLQVLSNIVACRSFK